MLVEARLIAQDSEQNLRIAHEAVLRHWHKGVNCLVAIADAQVRKARLRQMMFAAFAIVFLIVAVFAWLFKDQAETERDRTEAQFLKASFNLARVHEEKAVGILNEPVQQRDSEDYQRAVLQALHSQRQQLGGVPALRRDKHYQLDSAALQHPFGEQWTSPALNLISPVRSVAFSHDGQLLASASDDNTVRLWDYRSTSLLDNGPAPSVRAVLLSETLQRLWELRVDGLDIVPESWDWLQPRDGYHVDQEITIAFSSGAQTTDGASEPERRAFNIRPLLNPPKPGQDKLDQLLGWLKAQGM